MLNETNIFSKIKNAFTPNGATKSDTVTAETESIDVTPKEPVTTPVYDKMRDIKELKKDLKNSLISYSKNIKHNPKNSDDFYEELGAELLSRLEISIGNLHEYLFDAKNTHSIKESAARNVDSIIKVIRTLDSINDSTTLNEIEEILIKMHEDFVQFFKDQAPIKFDDDVNSIDDEADAIKQYKKLFFFKPTENFKDLQALKNNKEKYRNILWFSGTINSDDYLKYKTANERQFKSEWDSKYKNEWKTEYDNELKVLWKNDLEVPYGKQSKLENEFKTYENYRDLMTKKHESEGYKEYFDKWYNTFLNDKFNTLWDTKFRPEWIIEYKKLLAADRQKIAHLKESLQKIFKLRV